jgi:ribosome-associated toxin RatA of RatAB toxin-antitoxin module
MPKIESRIQINAPRDSVWQLAQDVEKLPDILPDLDSLSVLEREEKPGNVTRTVTSWQGRIKQFNRRIDWTEEDLWNNEERTCRFWILKGDFNTYEGEWRFLERGENTEVVLDLEYEIIIPLVGALMGKVVQKLMQQNSDGMLEALKTEAERRAQES